MSTADSVAEEVGTLELVAGAGAGAGVIGGLAMGAILHGGAGMMAFIGALYGAPSVPAGWVTHLVNSVVIGLFFAALVSRPSINRRLETGLDFVIAGLLYATAVGLVVVGVMLPISMRILSRVEFPSPVLTLPSPIGEVVVVVSVAVAHLVYGVFLGMAYYTFRQPGGGLP